MAKLAVFDVDGTLLNTSRVDAECYLEAVETAYGLTRLNPDWTSFRHATDLGVTRELIKRETGRRLNRLELKAFIQTFAEKLRRAYDEAPDGFREIPGAIDLIKNLSGSHGWMAAIATGGCLETAAFKLERAGISLEDFPFATSDDAASREEIVSICINRARRRYNVEGFTRIVSIGDAVWDVKTAANLGLPFIGIGDEGLKDLGVGIVLKEFPSAGEFVTLLEEAGLPVYPPDEPLAVE